MARFRGRVVVAPAFGLLIAALLLAGCALWQLPRPADLLADYRPALRPDVVVESALIAAMPRYSITVTIDPQSNTYTGTQEVIVPVTGTTAWNDLYFRLYPNLPQFGGGLEVRGARVNDLVVNYGYEADGTAVHLALPRPFLPGQEAHVWMAFVGKAQERKPGTYTIFGASEEILSLTNFYPILAGRRGNAWALDVASPLGDVGFHDASLYRVEVTVPADQIVASTGVTVTEAVHDGWVTRRYVHGPAREFTLMMSRRFQWAERDAYGTVVRSYFLPEDAEAGRLALHYAVAALQIYSDQFGPYPYRTMAVVEAPLTFRGMEFPGLSLIGEQTYNRYRQDLENLVVHEVAHQWWYNQVGSDQTLNPWLDEGLAEWTMYAYYLARYGHFAAERLREQRWQAPVRYAVQTNTDRPIGLPVKAYGREDYERTVYAKGALFFAALRDEIGPEAFHRLLREYLTRYRWRIASPQDFQALANEIAGRDLSRMFEWWVGRTNLSSSYPTEP
ncbi:MAG: M1 family metallopeptidase [Anaerolineae bacterium]